MCEIIKVRNIYGISVIKVYHINIQFHFSDELNMREFFSTHQKLHEQKKKRE